MSKSRKVGPAPVEVAAVELLGRPLSARSVIASLLLGRRPPRARPALLVRWCSLFGIQEGTARVALTRMVERGELRAEDGAYELAGRVRRRQREQEAALGGPGPWDGHWTLWVVHPGARTAADRTALRGAAGRARLAEVRDGLWTRPANLGPAVVAEDDQELLRRSADRWLARPEHEPAEQAARLFPVLDLERAGRRLEQRLDDVRADLAGPDLDDAALALAFVVGSAVLRHLRRDPLLPDELVQPTVGGAPVAGRLRAAYPAYEADFGRAVAAWWDRGPAARDSRA